MQRRYKNCKNRKRYKGWLIICGVVLFAVGINYLLSIESKRSLLQKQFVPITVSPDSDSSKKNVYPDKFILQVIRSSQASLRNITPSVSLQHLYFEKTISDPVVVQNLYKAILALPQDKDTICTFNVHFATDELRFFASNKLILDATVNISSCGSWVSIKGSDLTRTADPVFMSLLTKSSGLTEHELYGLGKE